MSRFGIRSSRTKLLYERVLVKSQEWANDEQMMYVIGATKATALTKVRQYAPNHFLLVPGVGAQGGSLQEVAEYGMNSKCGLIVNSSRGIIFASDGTDFAEKAGEKAKELQMEMEVLLRKKGLV